MKNNIVLPLSVMARIILGTEERRVRWTENIHMQGFLNMNKTKILSVQLEKVLDFGLSFVSSPPPPSNWDRVKCGKCGRDVV